MVRQFAKLAISFAILFTLLSAVQPAPVHAAASMTQQAYAVSWNSHFVIANLNFVSGDAVVVGVAGYAPCPSSGCPPWGRDVDQVLGLSNVEVYDSKGSAYQEVVADSMATASNTEELFVVVYVGAPSSGGQVSIHAQYGGGSGGYVPQELDIYAYEVRGVFPTQSIPYSLGVGSDYNVQINSVPFSGFPGAFLLGIVGTECPAGGNGYSIDMFPGSGYTISPALHDPSPPPQGKCTSLHAEYSTSGAEANGFTTFPATLAGTTNPRWVEVGIVLNSHIQAYSTTATESATNPTVTSQGASTDWAVVQVWVQPTLPTEGTPVTLGMTLVALSTTGGYPQKVNAQCTIDGSPCGSGTITYPGPTGTSFKVTTNIPWNAVAGTHTLSWQVDPANDPNSANNLVSTPFTVQSAVSQSLSASTTQASSTTTIESSTPQITVIQTQTVTQPPTSTTSEAIVQPGLLDILQQNSLLLIGALGLLVIILAAAVMIRRGKSGAPTTPSTKTRSQ